MSTGHLWLQCGWFGGQDLHELDYRICKPHSFIIESRLIGVGSLIARLLQILPELLFTHATSKANDMAEIHETSQGFTLPESQLSTSSTFKRRKSFISLASDEIELVEPNDFANFGSENSTLAIVKYKVSQTMPATLASKRSPGGHYYDVSGLACYLLACSSATTAVHVILTVILKYHAIYTPWTSSGLFAINIKIGSLTFWQVKFLDVARDMVVGRGGQAFLAIFTYVVFTKALTRTMEKSSIPHDTCKAITLQNDTASGLFLLAKNLRLIGDRRATGALVWTIISASFVLLFPTWLSAMTGYVAEINPYISLADDTTVSIDKFQLLVYTIHDGARLSDSLSTDTRVYTSWDDDTGYLDPINVYDCDSSYLNLNITTGSLSSESYAPEQCLLVRAVSNGARVNQVVALDSPSLNISAHLVFVEDAQYDALYYKHSYGDIENAGWNRQPYGLYWKHPNTNQYTFQKNEPLLYENDSKTLYTLQQMKDNGACQQAPGIVKYQWGFSFFLLYVFVITLLVWVIGLWIFYFDSILHSRLNDRAMGYERAVLDLAQSMQAKMPIREAGLCSNNELQAYTRDNLISFVAIAPDTTVPTRWMRFRRDYSFQKWSNDEKWWLAALLAFTVLWGLSFIIPPLAHIGLYLYGMLPGFGIFCVLLVGKETYERWTLFAVSFIGFVVMIGYFAGV